MHNTSMSVTQRVVALPAGASTLLAAAVPAGRHYLGLQVIGAGDVTLGFDAAAVVGSGWLVPATGGMLWSNAEGAPTNAVYGISAVATSVVVLEG